MLLLPMSSMAQKVAYAVFKGSTLTFYFNDKKPKRAYDVNNMIKDDFDRDVKEWYPKCGNIKTVVLDKSFKEYRPKSCSHWFAGCEKLTSIKGIKENLYTSNVTDMCSMFEKCDNLSSLDVSGFCTDNVTNMKLMFAFCKELTSLDVSGFNSDNVTDMEGMFFMCEKLTSLDVSGFNTDNVTNMIAMFGHCENLTSIDVSGFNTEKVTNMHDMFSGCANLSSIDVSGFNTDNVTEMNAMFGDCKNLKSLDVSDFNTENVLDMRFMFLGCKQLTSLDISNFDTNKVSTMWLMFANCNNIKTIYVGDGWNTNSVTNSEKIFNNNTNLIGGKGTKYDENHTNAEYAHIDGGESNPGYFTKK